VPPDDDSALSRSALPVAARLSNAVQAYRNGGSFDVVLAELRRITKEATAEDLIAAVEPFRDIPEVAGPVYERVVEQRPDDARALVILANSYWLTGRGPDAVQALAERALTADPEHRGAWHLWAIVAPSVRERVTRWQHVARRFASDDLARAALADNAASLASTEDDPVALQLAIDTFTDLLTRAQNTQQRIAIERALKALRGA
jgi:tetratricopeptide (TPR) repeat protein